MGVPLWPMNLRGCLETQRSQNLFKLGPIREYTFHHTRVPTKIQGYSLIKGLWSLWQTCSCWCLRLWWRRWHDRYRRKHGQRTFTTSFARLSGIFRNTQAQNRTRKNSKAKFAISAYLPGSPTHAWTQGSPAVTWIQDFRLNPQAHKPHKSPSAIEGAPWHTLSLEILKACSQACWSTKSNCYKL